RQCRLIALWNAVATAKRAVLHVRGLHDERVAGERAGGEAAKRVRRPCGRMRPPVHPDPAMPLRRLCPDVNRDQPLGMRVALFPDAEVSKCAHLVWRDVGFALMMAER